MSDNIELITDFYPDHTFIKADGFDHRIIGIEFADPDNPRLIYDTNAVIDALVMTSSTSYEDAQEFFDFNIAGAIVGPQTPIWAHTMSNIREGK